MRRFLLSLVLVLALFAGMSAGQGPLSNALNLPVTSNSSGALFVSGVAAGAQGPLTTFGNIALANCGSGVLCVAMQANSTITAPLTLANNGIAATSTDGAILSNSTASTVGTTAQWAPRLRFTGTAWKSNATAASEQNQLIQELRPMTGAAATTFNFVWAGAAAGAGSFTDLMTLTSAADVGLGTTTPNLGMSSSHPVLTLFGTAAQNSGTIEMAGNAIQSANPMGRLAFTNTVSGTTTTNARIQGIRDGADDAGALLLQTRAASGVVTERFRITSTGDILQTNKTTQYNSINTAGGGLPSIYGYGDVTAVVNTGSAAIATYTVGAADATFEVGCNVLVTTSTTHSFSCDVTYTDEGNTARTMVLPMEQLGGAFITNGLITNVTGAGPYEAPVMTIRAKAATAITVRTSAGGTFTTVTYNGRGVIKQVS